MEFVLKAHMPGLVARVVVEVGEKVEKNQELAVINCMKTEMSCLSPEAGVIKEILVAEWDEMDIGSDMIILEG
ncbi:MAG: acetyl-CoA carboxylase biotin carboxyl carrier protein subunit [Clostridiales Family XIII bacterium]|jgi:biotin carboxyl carrier protein|nr:acetyl-CoA carboxylase biotin carboxyl carrier protein subunit [Clostridiales Family XIII bacterium]